MVKSDQRQQTEPKGQKKKKNLSLTGAKAQFCSCTFECHVAGVVLAIVAKLDGL